MSVPELLSQQRLTHTEVRADHSADQRQGEGRAGKTRDLGDLVDLAS